MSAYRAPKYNMIFQNYICDRTEESSQFSDVILDSGIFDNVGFGRVKPGPNPPGVSSSYRPHVKIPYRALVQDYQKDLDIAHKSLIQIDSSIYGVVGGRSVPVVISNKCGASISSIAAGHRSLTHLRKSGHTGWISNRPMRVIWIDAHADYNTPETTETGYLGGMVVSSLTGRWKNRFSSDIDPANILIVGARAIDRGEEELLIKDKIKRCAVTDLEKVRDFCIGHSVWVHIDLDVLEPGQVTTEYSIPGGCSVRELSSLLHVISSMTTRIIGYEVAEFVPTFTRSDSESLTNMYKSVLSGTLISGFSTN